MEAFFGPCPPAYPPLSPRGCLYSGQSLAGRLDLQNPEFWFPPTNCQPLLLLGGSAPIWGGKPPSSRAIGREMFSSVPQSLDPRGGGSLCCGDEQRRRWGVSQLLKGEESWKGETGGGGHFPLQLGFKDLLPPTQLIVDGTHQSLTYILASATGSDSAVFVAQVLSIPARPQICGWGLPVGVLFQYWFEESSGGSFFFCRPLDTPYS